MSVDDSEYVEIEVGGQIRESPCCPECGAETDDYVRYRSCPTHGVVLKAVERRVGYRPMEDARADNNTNTTAGTETGQ